MQDRNEEPDADHSGSDEDRDIPLKWVGDAIVKPTEEPPELPDDKRIHNRRPLPTVPKGPSRDKDEE